MKGILVNWASFSFSSWIRFCNPNKSTYDFFFLIDAPFSYIFSYFHSNMIDLLLTLDFTLTTNGNIKKIVLSEFLTYYGKIAAVPGRRTIFLWQSDLWSSGDEVTYDHIFLASLKTLDKIIWLWYICQNTFIINTFCHMN